MPVPYLKQVLTTSALALTTGLITVAAAAADKGQDVYAANKCSTCHQIAGKGNRANPLDGVGAKLSAADIKEWIVDPVAAAAKAKSTKKPVMPPKYKNMSAADLDALVAYLQTLK
jgi:mono/diheme cytochrome c family protein